MLPQVNFNDPEETATFIREAFASEPARLQHLEVIADNVRESAKHINRSGLARLDEDIAYCAALLHDVGKIPELQSCGFHPLDGAQFLRDRGFADMADLIEGHSSSAEEAEIRGLPTPAPTSHLIAKLITYWDMRVQQGGRVVPYDERLQEILDRYGRESIVGRAHLIANLRIQCIFKEVEKLLSAI